MKLGLVTYNMAQDWDVPTLIAQCRAAGFEGVELRTTHAHGVEPSLGAERRREVRRQFEDAGITLWGLGTTCEYHALEAAVVQENIATCRAFVELARDVGARGVKVRPNGLHEERGRPRDRSSSPRPNDDAGVRSSVGGRLLELERGRHSEWLRA
jgi:sugar phosphate isomerase/epimerase